MKAVDAKIAELKEMGVEDDYSLDPFANSDVNLDELTNFGSDPLPLSPAVGFQQAAEPDSI